MYVSTGKKTEDRKTSGISHLFPVETMGRKKGQKEGRKEGGTGGREGGKRQLPYAYVYRKPQPSSAPASLPPTPPPPWRFAAAAIDYAWTDRPTRGVIWPKSLSGGLTE